MSSRPTVSSRINVFSASKCFRRTAESMTQDMIFSHPFLKKSIRTVSCHALEFVMSLNFSVLAKMFHDVSALLFPRATILPASQLTWHCLRCRISLERLFLFQFVWFLEKEPSNLFVCLLPIFWTIYFEGLSHWGKGVWRSVGRMAEDFERRRVVSSDGPLLLEVELPWWTHAANC